MRDGLEEALGDAIIREDVAEMDGGNSKVAGSLCLGPSLAAEIVTGCLDFAAACARHGRLFVMACQAAPKGCLKVVRVEMGCHG